MRRLLLATCAALALLTGWAGNPGAGQEPPKGPVGPPAPGKGPATPEKKFPDFDTLVKGAKEYDGLFKLYHKDEHLFAEIKPDKLNKPLLCPIAIARGMGLGGYTLNFDEQWVLLFKRASETKLHLIRRNVRFQAKAGSPAAKAVETTYTDSVLMAIPIKSIHPGRQGILIDLGDIFMTDFARLGMGMLDKSRSTWFKVKAFPKNVEIQVSATFAGGRRFFLGDDSVIDPRGNTIVLHYGLVELPQSGYQPRLADDRVGYFLSAVKDFSTDSKDTSFVRYVNRWRLERADTDAKNKNKLSVPKKKIVFWIEKSVPYEYRAYAREGILEWNKAFEKVGFRDAIEVRQQENEDFDPEDINYCTFRWITTGGGFAMGPSRANPLTGEILDADIIFDADMVRYWKQEAKMFGATGTTLDEQPSKIRALRQGWGLAGQPGTHGSLSWDNRQGLMIRKDADDPDPRLRLAALRQGVCQCGPCMKYELGLASLALGLRDGKAGGDGVPEELIGQAIKMVVMHEVGHTLGLRHNFKASSMLKNEQLHDTSITRKKGMAGSVMDYLPVNLAPKGVQQGDYFSTTIGAYDYWAIAYAYKPLDGGTEGEWAKLQEIAKRGAEPGHDYGTDEDMYGTSDPLINAFDLGADTMKFAMDRMLIAEELLKTLHDKVIDKGEGYQRVRQAFNMLLWQYGDGAYLVANHVGGELAHRDHRDDPKGRDPLVPVKAARQRKALEFLKEHVLTERYFKFSPQLLRRLGSDRWSHWGAEGGFYGSVDYPLHDRILLIQRIVLDQLLNPGTLNRIQNNALKTDPDENALTVAEVFRTLTDGVWVEYPVKGGPQPKGVGKATIIRRNLQREHVKELSNLVLGPQARGGSPFMIFFGSSARVPPDAKSLARLHLREIQGRIGNALTGEPAAALDDTTRAHLEECRERIGRVLNASLQLNEP
ncbi:MAG: zinc-dependent metalloprotease [Gemmataceae bacterium]|nr:zinc-dependent metalloprotease [Gemmataceae bacterium]